MNKKQCISICVALSFVLCTTLTACGGKSATLPDTFVEGSDWQYMQESGWFFEPTVQKGANGIYYFIWKGFVYYLDSETQSLLPLCSKADCLHDQETDNERMTECHAYVGETFSGPGEGINYCNGWVYSLLQDVDQTALIRISEDGTKKEEVYQWGSDAGIEHWIVHRDAVYYANHTYYMKDGELREKFALMQLPLDAGLRQPKELYATPENCEIYALSWIQGYGNYIYFQVNGSSTREIEVTDDNYMDYLFCPTMVCNLNTGEVTALTAPDMGAADVIQGVTFWQDRILLKPATVGQIWEETGTVYSANLDGSDPQIFMENFPQGDQILSDGKYLYLTNHNRVTRMGGGDVLYQVLDEDLNEVDTFTMPYEWPCYIRIGDPDMRFDIYYETEGAEDENVDMDDAVITGWGVNCWDKTTIGSYHGEPFAYTEIPYNP